jgi:hypothetical protein
MKAYAPTVVVCFTADPDDNWFVKAPTRIDAEALYLRLIAEEKVRPPLYRVICQAKIDQHDGFPSDAIH